MRYVCMAIKNAIYLHPDSNEHQALNPEFFDKSEIPDGYRKKPTERLTPK